MIMLDTHIAVALYEGRLAGLSSAARRALDHGQVLISPAVVMELEMLHEIRRIRIGGAAVARHLSQELDIEVAGDRFADVVHEALALSFTRDPFDRLLVAHAMLLKSPLLSCDQTIERAYSHALS
jgi:PIN domain nuclease of toxin-antitoxin system